MEPLNVTDDESNRVILISIDPDNPDYGVVITAPRSPYWAGDAAPSIKINMGPNPTWPTAAESHQMIADGVRDLLDTMWEFNTGEKIER